jgi:ferredoxin-NADP reductase
MDNVFAERLQCVDIQNETHDVKTFHFSVADQRPLVFKPGQFLTLELNINGNAVNRCYSFSSEPRNQAIAITVKRVANGLVSNWLHDSFSIGDHVSILPPAGEFSTQLYPRANYLFLSAGSGITPIMSMTRHHHSVDDDANIVFIHSTKTPADFIFGDELNQLAKTHPKFKLHLVYSRNEGTFSGRLTYQQLLEFAPDLLQRSVFVCGPSSYRQAVRAMLTATGINAELVHEESYSFTDLQQDDVIKSQISTAAEFTVLFQEAQREIQCKSDQSILAAAQAAGMRLASSCQQGVCGTCKVKLMSGEVMMTHQGGIRQREIDQGMILLCCSKPLTELVIAK